MQIITKALRDVGIEAKPAKSKKRLYGLVGLVPGARLVEPATVRYETTRRARRAARAGRGR